jgi:hypothetical protein
MKPPEFGQAEWLFLQAVLFVFNLNSFHEYLVQQSLKLGGTNYHFKEVKVPGTTTY